MDYSTRPATLADVPGIIHVARYTWDVTYAQSIAIHNRQQFLARAYTPQTLREAIEQTPGWFYVALQAETVVGFAQYLRRFDAQVELVHIYVHPDHQRRGIGRALLATGLTALSETGTISQCYVSVEANNVTARTFYERFGFRLRREYGRFLGDQIIRLVEYSAPIVSLLRAYQRTTSRFSGGLPMANGNYTGKLFLNGPLVLWHSKNDCNRNGAYLMLWVTILSILRLNYLICLIR